MIYGLWRLRGRAVQNAFKWRFLQKSDEYFGRSGYCHQGTHILIIRSVFCVLFNDFAIVICQFLHDFPLFHAEFCQQHRFQSLRYQIIRKDAIAGIVNLYFCCCFFFAFAFPFVFLITTLLPPNAKCSPVVDLQSCFPSAGLDEMHHKINTTTVKAAPRDLDVMTEPKIKEEANSTENTLSKAEQKALQPENGVVSCRYIYPLCSVLTR